MVKLDVIAHELGHVICAKVHDGINVIDKIILESNDNVDAWCEYSELKQELVVESSYKKFKGMFHLGGIFGEILYHSKWNACGARRDIDDFVTPNKKNTKFICEIDSWFWIDDDALSFRGLTAGDSEYRTETFITFYETAIRLPELWKAFLDFCSRIDTHEFIKTVDEIHNNEITIITKKEINKIIRRVVL
ncbi:MAG: hypothetical protein KKB59_19785 [Spirochaetes bacterium]|nr:hypothetical protein [Spirochaetota bacterium]